MPCAEARPRGVRRAAQESLTRPGGPGGRAGPRRSGRLAAPWVLWVLSLLPLGCGGSPVCGLTDTPPCPKRFTLAHLPGLLRFIAFGETRPADVQARFMADHLYVTSSVGRDLRVRFPGPNHGRRYAYVDVVRRTENGTPLGQLGDAFSLRFEFTEFDEDGPLLLFGVQVTQPRSAPDVCLAARELANADGLTGCPPHSARPPAAPDPLGFFHACVQEDEDPDDARLLEVYCTAPSADTRRLRVALALGREP